MTDSTGVNVQSPRPHYPALIICQEARPTPNRLVDIAGMMNAIGITQLPATAPFFVHFSLTEGRGDFRMPLYLEQVRDGVTTGDRLLLWSGDVSVRAPEVVHEQSIPVSARFFAPGQCRIALYANGELVGRRPLSILKPL